MAKKNNQWALDRAFSLNKENEGRIRGLLSCIKRVKEQNWSIDDAITKAVENEWLTKRGREGYEQSTATLLRSIGLITQNEYETTEIADAFVEKEITYKEMLLMQLAKKEFRYDENSEIVHPLLVTLKTILLLKKENDDQGWIDAYDYLYFLTELKSMNDIENMVESIIEKREEDERIIEYDNIYDFDMWISAFVTTGLIEERPHKTDATSESIRYQLNEQELELIEWLTDDNIINNIENIEEFTRSGTRNEVLKQFGKLSNGIVKFIPTLTIEKDFSLNNAVINTQQVLREYLFKGASLKTIEEDLFDIDNSNSKGFFSALILESYGILDKKGIWKIFNNYQNLVKASLLDAKETKIYKELFEDSEIVLDNYKKAALYLKEYAFNKKIDIHARDKEIKEWRNAFVKKFSPESLKQINDNDLLEKLFFTKKKTNDSLGYWLDRKKDNGLFGGTVLANSEDMGVAQNTKTGQWKVRRNDVAYEDALEEGKIIKNKLIQSAEIVRKMQLDSLSDYERLDNLLKKALGEEYYYDKNWIRKYLSILYPQKLMGIFADDSVIHVLNCLKIKPRSIEKKYVLNGQLSLVLRNTGWVYWHFYTVFNEHFGFNKKKIYKIGDKIDAGANDFTDHTGEWEDSPYIAIGWSQVGDLSLYNNIKKEIYENYEELDFYVDAPANIRSGQAGQIDTFYNISNQKTGYDAIAVVACGSRLQYLVDNLQKYEYHSKKDAHRIKGNIHYCFLNEDRLSNQKKYERHATCKVIDEEDNREQLLELYYYHLEEYENRKHFYDWIIMKEIMDDDQAYHTIQILSGVRFSEYIVDKSIFAYTEKVKINKTLSSCKEKLKDGIDIKLNKERIAALKLYKKYLKGKEDKKMITLDYQKGFESEKEKNRIVFGAPGTGKSYEVDRDRIDLLGEKNENNFERVTFHSDYTYAQFVGTYKPYMEGDEIQYRFVPGPFMRVLTKALKNIYSEEDTKPYVLIVEEINRANVAAVFGDIFQLLDRNENGASEYELETTEEIRDYLSDEFDADPDSFEKIRIPSNMFIWATMNSADQGVFPMDTAFKRRWNFEYLDIDNNDEIIENAIVFIREGQEEIVWNDLRKSINDKLVSLGVNEDKLIGPFFIDKEVLDDEESKTFNKVFKNKLLMYLFEDAAKQKRNEIFNEKIDSDNPLLFSKVCKYYDDYGLEVFHKDISDKFIKEEV